MLEELCDELTRNGFNKIIFVDGHGGNSNFLKYFMQSRLEKYHPYITYYFDAGNKEESFWIEYQSKFQRVLESGHACEFETSSMMAINEELVNLNKVNPEETKAKRRLNHISNSYLYTGISWYSDYPNQIAGDPSNASVERGKYVNNYTINKLLKAIRSVKEDDKSIELLNEYYNKHNNPEGF